MNGQALKKILETATEENMKTGGASGPMSSLWEELPSHVAGPEWVAEVVNCAERMAEYIYDSEDIDEDQLTDWALDFANSEVEDYYVNINNRVQALSLWAYDELDEEVASSWSDTESTPTLNDLNMRYLYCAMRGLFECVARWAVAEFSELEEVEA